MTSTAIPNDVAIDAPSLSFTPVQPDTADLIGIARRHVLLIITGILLGAIAALALLSLTPPTYKANARILIDKNISRYMQSNKVVDEPIYDDASTWSQTHIIASENVMLPVVLSMGLTKDPEFVGSLHGEESPSWIHKTITAIKDASGIFTPEEVARPADTERAALQSAMLGLSVFRDDIPNVINISFKSKDPVKASQIANAIADSYLTSTLAGKLGSMQTVGKMMQERLDELKTQAAAAERELIEYKVDHQLLSSGEKTKSSEELSNLITRLAEARVAVAEAKARLDPISDETDDDAMKAGATADNPLLTRLREQYLDVSDRATDIERRVGSSHLAVVNLRKRMADIQVAIHTEQKRVAERDYELASARYNELTSSMSEVLGEETSSSPVRARVLELESAAETLRTLYTNMLVRFNDTNKVDVDANIFSDTQIISRASVPTQTESSKKRYLVLAIGCFFGLCLGSGAALAREFPFGVFRTPEQVKRATGLFSTVLPAVKVSKGAKYKITEYVLDKPFSSFAESLRIIWSMISTITPKQGGGVICVVSSKPGEGKTTVSTNLACLVASHANARTLLIDADFHLKTLSAALAPEARQGLKEALDNPEHLSKFVVKREESGLDVLPCPVEGRLTNAAELLGSSKMKELIRVAQRNYDSIIIEVAPIDVVADFRMIAPICDGFVFVVEWGRTSQKLVLESLSVVPGAWERVLCVVLNKANPKALKSVNRYKGSRYNTYYQDHRA